MTAKLLPRSLRPFRRSPFPETTTAPKVARARSIALSRSPLVYAIIVVPATPCGPPRGPYGFRSVGTHHPEASEAASADWCGARGERWAHFQDHGRWPAGGATWRAMGRRMLR
jgi:hypothetical protein